LYGHAPSLHVHYVIKNVCTCKVTKQNGHVYSDLTAGSELRFYTETDINRNYINQQISFFVVVHVAFFQRLLTSN